MAIDTDGFQRDGYLLVRGLFTPTEAASALAAVQDALDPDEANELTLGSMRFASNLYRRSPAIRRVLADPRLVGLVSALLGPSSWCRWDQAVCKGPGSSPFPWHQDNGYTRLRDEHLQVWVALTDAPAERGGLMVEPGAHRVPRQHRWVGSHVELLDPPQHPRWLAAEAGDVVAFSSLLPHSTGPNATDVDRWTYVAEFLPLDVDDDSVEAPHFVLSRGGRVVGRLEADRYAPTP